MGAALEADGFLSIFLFRLMRRSTCAFIRSSRHFSTSGCGVSFVQAPHERAWPPRAILSQQTWMGIEMSVVLCHESALRYWLTKISNEAVPSVSPCQSLSFSSANMRDVRLDALSFDYSEKRPLHVLVCDSDSVRNQRCLVAHRWSGVLPPGSFYELSGSNLVSSP